MVPIAWVLHGSSSSRTHASRLSASAARLLPRSIIIMFKSVVLLPLLVVCSAVGPEDGCCLSPEKMKTGVSFNISYSLMLDRLFERIPKEKSSACQNEWRGYQVLDGHGKGNRHTEVRCESREVSAIIYKSITVMGDGTYFAIDYRNGTETCERVCNETDMGCEQWTDQWGQSPSTESCWTSDSWYLYEGEVVFGSVKAVRYSGAWDKKNVYADIDFENGCVPITLASTYGDANWHVTNFKFGAPSAHSFDIPESCKKGRMMVV